MKRGILLDENNDLKVIVRRDSNGLITQGLCIGEREVQDAYIVLKANQGEIKEDPIIGANLIRMIRSKADKERIRKTIKISLQRVGVEFENIKGVVATMINNKEIDL